MIKNPNDRPGSTSTIVTNELTDMDRNEHDNPLYNSAKKTPTKSKNIDKQYIGAIPIKPVSDLNLKGVSS